jgi:probable addiction module antidote protein
MAEEFFPFDPTEALNSRAAIAFFLADAFETGDAEDIAEALSIVARAEGMETLAAQTGMPIEVLNNALNETEQLTLKTMLAVVKAVGLNLSVTSEASQSKYRSG